MKKYQNIALTIFIIILILAGFIWFFSSRQESGVDNLNLTNGILTSQESVFDFDTISMAKGIVSHAFKIKNTGSEALVIKKIYTSCMCTEATFVKGDIKKGPFGMLGHGFIPQISEILNPGEEAEILIVFDPAAHGPAGLGRTERVVYLENSGKNPKFELLISVNVAP